MKKVISILLLASMTFHCLSRMEVVSYVYAHRYDLAYSLGITAERVIAMCKGDYFPGPQLTAQHEDEGQVPSAPASSQEIILGCPPAVLLTPNAPVELIAQNTSNYFLKEYHSPYSDIFHPPLA